MIRSLTERQWSALRHWCKQHEALIMQHGTDRAAIAAGHSAASLPTELKAEGWTHLQGLKPHPECIRELMRHAPQ